MNILEKIKLDRKTLIIITSISSLVIISFLAIFLYLPLVSDLAKTAERLRLKQQELTTARLTVETLRKIDKKRKFMTQEEIPQAIDELTRAGRALNISFSSISPKEIENSESAPYQIFPIQMELESGYEELGSFLGVIEELEESVATVRSFQIHRDEKILPRLKSALVLEIYLINGENG